MTEKERILKEHEEYSIWFWNKVADLLIGKDKG